jgi:hypothetical protein
MEDGGLALSANHDPTFSAGLPTNFTHTPLDYCAPSIRLVLIQATKSSEGLIQCILRYASTASTYLCLSYVWGADDCGQWILVNGQRFWIRQNLYDFFSVARQQPQWQSRWIWIDALCIDQSNAIERNHQVKQMGDIFAGAVKVVAWLGTQKEIITFLKNSKRWKATVEAARKNLGERKKRAEIIEEKTCAILSSSDDEEDIGYRGSAQYNGGGMQANADGFRYFCYTDYWDRAWITQEVALARQLTFMAGKASLRATSISFAYEQFCQLRVAALDPRTTPELRGRSLIYLMERFKFKKSGVVRDRVFSLLSLCGDGSDVLVDYDVTDLQVAENVLESCKRSFCLCSIDIVAFVLRVQSQLPFSQYVLTSRKDYARITLSVTMDYFYFNYDRESPPVLYETTRYTSLVILKVRSLCRSYGGRIRVSNDSWRTNPSVKYEAEYDHGSWDIHIPEGCQIDISSDQESCTASFSLEFLCKIVQLDRSWRGCCERVTCEGTTSAWPSSEAVLSLST